MMALVDQFTNIDYDVLLYDPQSNQNRRGEFVANMVKESGAQGLVLFMQQFCDPEEMEFPYLKKALDAAGIPFIKLGIDQQMRDFGQCSPCSKEVSFPSCRARQEGKAVKNAQKVHTRLQIEQSLCYNPN